ncbi:TldD/PmbA family protein [Solicola gregarius]|uniref:TldD/PmbA family protein n=1 Tax=Solicola gregarius TaxID=2908642 RepID=A0AA46THB3_9ACTN|nr:TldD/PmbA family protein [Solicola gregarius]UYM05135.1 TldD/PmbA family protein [Solicola gregarius]
MADVDPTFTDLPLERLADAALQRARDFGASHADFRLERLRSQTVALRDGALEGAHDGEQLGMCVRVIVDGTWGFASTFELTNTAAVRTAEEAVRVAHVSAPVSPERVELAPEPTHRRAVWVSSYDIDPLGVPLDEKVTLLGDWSRDLAAAPAVAHVSAHLEQYVENKFYADLSGTSTTQQRVRLHPELEVYGERDGRIDAMRTIAPPVGRGWEYLTDGRYDWAGELAALPDQLAEKLAAPSVEPGTYDVVIDPTNLWLTIHESIGHATELDRALGYEANFAGTSFATYDQLGTLQYGSPVMHVTGDRTVEHGLSTVGYDDDGVEAQTWDLIRDGVLVGYQLDRAMAGLNGFDRSNGCAFADSPARVPIQRMANVSLQPAADGPDTDGLIADVERGLYIVGDKSWSIDMQRYNFQFTGQRFYRIEDGELRGQVRDAAYQATTTDFWRSMSAVGGPQTWRLCGAFNCGKAQPAQVAAVSHGAPSALFRDVSILNTQAESGR